MRQRLEVAKQDSDTAFYFHLLYFGEMMAKTIVAAMVASIADDQDRSRYRQMHRLVRADGIGEWQAVLEEVLTGPSSQYLIEEARQEQKELTQKVSPGTWQYEACTLLDSCLRVMDKSREGLLSKLDGKKWFVFFAELRNKTRAHGATSPALCSKLVPSLESSINLLASNFSLFRREWAYLHRNLSGKYRIMLLSHSSQQFDDLKISKGALKWGPLQDGVFIFWDRPYRVDLMYTDSDVSDFFYPNGAFTGKKFELISYITDTKQNADAAPFMMAAADLPRSETQGLGALDIQDQVFGNLPALKSGYVKREDLEQELYQRLLDDRHPVITLIGRGGIGKTSLALSVLYKVAGSSRFGAIFWFSSRDIDLLPEGPKLVRPHLMTEADIAAEFVRLLSPKEASLKGFKAATYFTGALTKSPLDNPILFVFDNFETVKSPMDIFVWLDTYIRLPNKVLITSRSREFKGDYPVEVFGMTEPEADLLVDITAKELGITQLITEEYRRDLYRESEGHPYVIKVLLGEVAKAGKLERIRRLVASREGILDALFERTYSALSPAARLVFLTLCSWRATIPVLALEAVMLRPANERMDVEAAIEELRRSSFIEVSQSEEDDEAFISVPLVAFEFGRRKLSVTPMKAAVEANMQWLLYFGAGQKTDVRHGIGPRVERFFRTAASEISRDTSKLPQYSPIMEFIADRYPPAWLLLASLYEETAADGSIETAKIALQRYLEHATEDTALRHAWFRLGLMCRQTGDWVGEVHALVEMCSLAGTSINDISNAINRWNLVFRQQFVTMPSDERHILGQRLLSLFDQAADQAEATDYSRAAWLALALGDRDRAAEYTRKGLRLDGGNEYCLNLAERLNLQLEIAGS